MHSVAMTPANESDVVQAHALLHGGVACQRESSDVCYSRSGEDSGTGVSLRYQVAG